MITFTDNAIKKLESAIEPDDYVRVGVVGGGCSGLSYTVQIEENKKEGDIVLNISREEKTSDVKVIMDPFSNFTLSEVTVDYLESLHQSGFQFENPTAKKTCGCGTSFKPQDGGPEVPAGGCSTGGCGVS